MGTASSLKSDECESESNTTKFSLQKSPEVGIRHRMFVHFIRLSRSAVASRIRGLGFDPERGEFRMFVVGAFQNVWRQIRLAISSASISAQGIQADIHPPALRCSPG